MNTYIALLKGVNVAGQKMIAMSDLRDLCATLGHEDVRSLLQSGNLVFRSGKKNGPVLERQLEEALTKRLGIKTDFFVRTSDEWSEVAARNPFPEEAESNPGRLITLFLKTAPKAGGVEALRAAIKGPEKVHLVGTELYAVYPDGAGRSKLTNALIEKHLGASCTGRNWNTVLKLSVLTNA